MLGPGIGAPAGHARRLVDEFLRDGGVAHRREQRQLLRAVAADVGAARQRVEVVLEERLLLEADRPVGHHLDGARAFRDQRRAKTLI